MVLVAMNLIQPTFNKKVCFCPFDILLKWYDCFIVLWIIMCKCQPFSSVFSPLPQLYYYFVTKCLSHLNDFIMKMFNATNKFLLASSSAIFSNFISWHYRIWTPQMSFHSLIHIFCYLIFMYCVIMCSSSFLKFLISFGGSAHALFLCVTIDLLIILYLVQRWIFMRDVNLTLTKLQYMISLWIKLQFS